MAWPRARPAWPSAARLLLLLALACAEAGPAGPAGPASDMVVFIKEQCYQPALDMHALRQLVEGRARGAEDARLNVKFMSSKELCGAQPGELAALLAALSTDSTRAVVGSFEAAVCGVLDLLATMHPTKMIVTWGCPQQELVAGAVDYGHVPDGGPGGARVRRLLPPLAATVQGAVRVATYYRMRTAAIVSSGESSTPHGSDTTLTVSRRKSTEGDRYFFPPVCGAGSGPRAHLRTACSHTHTCEAISGRAVSPARSRRPGGLPACLWGCPGKSVVTAAASDSDTCRLNAKAGRGGVRGPRRDGDRAVAAAGAPSPGAAEPPPPPPPPLD
ncbi:hypothetical protein ONE63_006969 [Megalurothrips usitatus]|uniref:Receptor ligand binding region domain-containing protein n=1 Tax=Megalurothrips usitatus TaxID=439358 RepID=A0AAV7XT31_9NEOP|nr:hypothetical protein ONE63_006969 [Megalurothrips usitatus]